MPIDGMTTNKRGRRRLTTNSHHRPPHHYTRPHVLRGRLADREGLEDVEDRGPGRGSDHGVQ
eukprot:2536646-Pyramimonas_sp.AAC.1